MQRPAPIGGHRPSHPLQRPHPDAETAQVRTLIQQLKTEGVSIFLISHDIHDVFELSDRVTVMYHGRVVATVDKDKASVDEILGMIILGKKPGDVSEHELAALRT